MDNNKILTLRNLVNSYQVLVYIIIVLLVIMNSYTMACNLQNG